jgi:hypothetical protein
VKAKQLAWFGIAKWGGVEINRWTQIMIFGSGVVLLSGGGMEGSE